MELETLDKKDVRDIEDLLKRGFLVREVSIGGKSFLIKQVSSQEIRDFRYFICASPVPSNRQVFLRSCVASLGTVMVEGENVLEDRYSSIKELSRYFCTWSLPVLDNFLVHINEVSARYLHCLDKVPYYADTPRSRYLWRSHMQFPLYKGGFVVWPGAQNVGPCTVLELWCFLRRFFDDLDVQEKEWERLKWVVACQNSSAVKHLDSLEKARKQRREELPEILVKGEARKEKDLVDELHRSISGDYDEHDETVMGEEQVLLNRYLEHEKALHENAVLEMVGELNPIEVDSRELGSHIPGGVRIKKKNPLNTYCMELDHGR